MGAAPTGVASVRFTLTGGKSVTVQPVAVADKRLFAFAVGSGISLAGWTGYDASGREIGAGSVSSVTATATRPPTP